MTATVDNAVIDLQRANAELQRQLDERTAERDEALQREVATAEVLQVINSSPGDLGPVFDAMLEKAHSLCRADTGALLTYDRERFWHVAWHGMPAPSAEASLAGIDPNVAPSFGQIVRGERLDQSKPGSGLGLGIVKEIADLYGGVLTLGRSHLGGLSAELILPAADART